MSVPTFDGRSTEQLHEHYDPDGNLTGTTLVTVPGWTGEARAWALGLAEREASQCARGHDLTESLDWNYQWIPQPPAVCLACVGLDQSVKAHEKDPRHRSMLHTLRKVERPKPGNKRKRR